MTIKDTKLFVQRTLEDYPDDLAITVDLQEWEEGFDLRITLPYNVENNENET